MRDAKIAYNFKGTDEQEIFNKNLRIHNLDNF